MEITICGTGYVGLVTGACLAYLRHDVTCVDKEEAKIRALGSGKLPIYEPRLTELIAAAKERGTLTFSTDLAAAVRKSTVIFIAVGTPPQPSGRTDLSQVQSAARQIGAAMNSSRFRVVVNKSTVPVGSASLVDSLVRDGIESRSRSGNARPVDFEVASNPEFQREGCAVADALYPDRIVLGTGSRRSLNVLKALYQPLWKQEFPAPDFLPRPEGFGEVPLVTTTVTSAEMTKYAANAFLAMKISFGNEIANICERIGADIVDVTRGIGLDRRIGSHFLRAGIGWGGSCFGKDLQALMHTAEEYRYGARLLRAVYDVNCDQQLYAIQKLQEKLLILKGKTIALLGLAFKPDTDDLRDAPSLGIASWLLEMGARVRAYDPVASEACRRQRPDLHIQHCDSALDAVTQADAVVLVTDWAEFVSLDLAAVAARMRRPVLIDGRNVFDPVAAHGAGFDYAGVGRPSPRYLHAAGAETAPTQRALSAGQSAGS